MQFREIRCSSMGKLTTGVSLKAPVLTEPQKKLLEELQNKEKRTEKQDISLKELIEKRDSKPKLPTELTSGQKTHVQNIWYGDKFDFVKTFTNKFVEKGNIKENKSIKDVFEMLGMKFVRKNSTFKQNGFCKGTADIVLNSPSCIPDMKNVYYPEGLKFFKSGSAKELETQHDYEWQIKSYCWLWDKTDGLIIRHLCNPPEHILEKEIWTFFKQSEETEMTEDFRESVRQMFDFESKLTVAERTMIFPVTLTNDDVLIMENQVKLMNEYWKTLDDEFNSKNFDAFYKLKK